MEFNFIVYGEPVAKGRPRFSYNGRYVQTYTPTKTERFENLVKLCFKQAGGILFDGQLKMEIKCYWSIPKSFSKKKTQMAIDGEIMKTSKPDCDNVAKAICDSLNKIAYNDDSQIVVLEVYKYYSNIARTEITIVNI